MSSIAQVVAEIALHMPGRVQTDAPGAALVTYRCGGPLAVLVRASSEPDLLSLSEVLRSCPPVPVLVVGRGSNLLVSDAGFPGVAVILTGDLDAVAIDVAGRAVRAGGAAALPVLARRAAGSGLGGLEFYVGIPGSVGGAVRMNAGGHGSETKDVLVGARVVDLGTGAVEDRSAAELDLGYRRSNLRDFEVVVAATFDAVVREPQECVRRIEELVGRRRENQPGGANAGSVFRNPPGDSAGRLIDSSGLKGLRVGGAEVSRKHANFISAASGASAADVRALIDEVRRRVEAATGVRLVCELRMVGFDEVSGEAGG